jgi:hypothetical protein
VNRRRRAQAREPRNAQLSRKLEVWAGTFPVTGRSTPAPMNAYAKFAAVAVAACLATVSVAACEQRFAQWTEGETGVDPPPPQPDLDDHDC